MKKPRVHLIHGHWEKVHRDLPRQPDLVFADPPDNLGLAYDNYDDKLPDAEYDKLLSKWVRCCCRITPGPVFICFNERHIPVVEATIKQHDLRIIQRCWWYYRFGQANCKRYAPCVRPIYWLNADTIYPDAIKVPSDRQTIYGDKRAKGGGKMPANVWEFSRVCGTFKEKRKWHQCQIPEALVSRVILGHSKPGDLVLDPFVGSGTTAYVSAAHGRHCIGVDQSASYLQSIREELIRRGTPKKILLKGTNGAALPRATEEDSQAPQQHRPVPPSFYQDPRGNLFHDLEKMNQ